MRDRLVEIIAAGDANLINGVYPADPLLAARRHGGAAGAADRGARAAVDDAHQHRQGGRPDLGDRLRIRSLAFAVSPPAQHPICVTAASFAGRIHVNLLYDENKLPAERARAIAGSLMAHLERGAAVAADAA